MARIGLICNPRSQRNSKGIGEILEIARRHDVVLHLVEPHRPSDRAIADFAARGIDHLVVNGGDGTVQTIVTAMLRQEGWRPPVTLLAGGMTNVIARDVGMNRRPITALRRILPLLSDGHKGEGIPRRTLEVTPRHGAPFHGFLFGGIDFYTATMLGRADVHRLGVAQSVAVNLSILWSLILATLHPTGENAPFKGEELVLSWNDGERETGRVMLAMATTLTRLLPGVMPFWGEGSGEVRTTLVAHPPRRLWRAILPMIRGRPRPWMAAHGYRSRNVDRLFLSTRLPFILDGEAMPASDGLTLSSGPYVEFARF
ncbi:MAG TPA: acylglycerol kinase family protein [Dongiaceae bacterium]|jgi:hypothetical protein|nr:acylglycerol kinase family protein [Dongiaceae bacterium]